MSRPRDWSPLRPSDPVGGDADEIARLAERYAGTAEAIRTAATALREIHDSSTAWNSDAGRAFRDRTSEVADTIERAFDRYDQTARALATYARALDGIQSEADLVLARAKRAEEARDAAWRARERNASQPEPDPVAESRANDDAAAASGDIHAAGEDLDALESEWRTAGNTAADAIEEISNGDDLEDGFWDDVLDIVAVITDLAGKLSAVLGVIALVLSVIPGLQPFAAIFGAAALITGAVSLVGNTILYANDRASLSDVLWDVVGVVSFGAGRAFALAGRAMTTGTRGLARSSYIRHLRSTGLSRRAARRTARQQGVPVGGSAASALASRARNPHGWLPTRTEWAEAYRPSSLFREVVTGPAPVVHQATTVAPEVAAGLARAALASRASTAAGVAGNVGDARSIGQWATDGPAAPVETDR